MEGFRLGISGHFRYDGHNLVVGRPTPLKNMSMGWIIPYIMENKNVPNHQPVIIEKVLIDVLGIEEVYHGLPFRLLSYGDIWPNSAEDGTVPPV